MTPSALIAELEAAEQGSRELDGKIRDCLGLVDPKTKRLRVRQGGFKFISEGPRPFTTSLDSALSLVAKGWGWEIGEEVGGGTVGAVVWHATSKRNGYRSYGVRSAALALCVAALKARAALEQGR